ncbi:MAG: hypothetical protein AB9903_29890 [Vulcanimicrobiota bacterium]
MISFGGIRLEIENLLERLLVCCIIKMTLEVYHAAGLTMEVS